MLSTGMFFLAVLTSLLGGSAQAADLDAAYQKEFAYLKAEKGSLIQATAELETRLRPSSAHPRPRPKACKAA